MQTHGEEHQMIEVREVVELIDPKNVRAAIDASGISGRELGRRLEAHGNLVTRIINGRRHHVSKEEFQAIAEALAGEGDYAGYDAEAVKKVMRGFASFERRLVEGSNQPSTVPDQTRRLDRFGHLRQVDPLVKAA